MHCVCQWKLLAMSNAREIYRPRQKTKAMICMNDEDVFQSTLD